MESIAALIQSYMDRRAALGAAVALLKAGELVYLGGFGVTSVEESGAPVTPRTLFAYGSISKNICTALIMRLVEAGALDLDMPVLEYLPELHFSHAGYGGQVTLRHLLSHTSGLPMGGKNWGPRDPDALRRFVYEQIPHYTFLAEPGAVHLYSNTVFCIAGHVAEAVTGKFYDDLVREHVFDPLQMDRVTYDPVVAMTYSLALPHEGGPDGALHVIHRMAYNASGNPSSFAFGSVTDLAHLAQMYLNGGRFGDRRFLTAASVAEMQRTHASRHIDAALRPESDNYLGYGLGFELGVYRGRRTAGHGGMSQTYNCFFKLFPDDRAGVVVLTNQCDEDVLWDMVTALYDQVLGLPQPGNNAHGEPAAPSAPPGSNALQCYAGAYLRVETADLATFLVREERLVLEQDGKQLPLLPVGDDQFYAEVTETRGLTAAFVRNTNGQITHVMLGGAPYHPFEPGHPFHPDALLWKSFEGFYKDPSNSNREEMLAVRLRDGTLFVAEGAVEVSCRPVSNRCFVSDLGLFEFEDARADGEVVLVWGKATRYHPVDARLYGECGVIRYRMDIPTIPQRMDGSPGAPP